MTITEAPRHEDTIRHRIQITMNRRHRVKLAGPDQTGLSIKEAAIIQGVPIKQDFLLSRKDGKKFKPVGDNERIRVRDDEEFLAVDGDDNS